MIPPENWVILSPTNWGLRAEQRRNWQGIGGYSTKIVQLKRKLMRYHRILKVSNLETTAFHCDSCRGTGTVPVWRLQMPAGTPLPAGGGGPTECQSQNDVSAHRGDSGSSDSSDASGSGRSL